VFQAQVVALLEQAKQYIDHGFDECGFDDHRRSLPVADRMPGGFLRDRDPI
jgi:hypothetical protein